MHKFHHFLGAHFACGRILRDCRILILILLLQIHFKLRSYKWHLNKCQTCCNEKTFISNSYKWHLYKCLTCCNEKTFKQVVNFVTIISSFSDGPTHNKDGILIDQCRPCASEDSIQYGIWKLEVAFPVFLSVIPIRQMETAKVHFSVIFEMSSQLNYSAVNGTWIVYYASVPCKQFGLSLSRRIPN